MKGLSRTAARRYARALLEVAVEEGTPDVVRAELRETVALLQDHDELRSVLAHPAVATARKAKVLEALWAKRGPGPLTRRLVLLLAGRGRIGLLPAVEETYAALDNERRGVVAAEAVAAAELDEARRGALSAAIRQASGRDVELRTTVDPSILGGLLVRMGGKVYDGTVRTRLVRLRERLTGRSMHS